MGDINKATKYKTFEEAVIGVDSWDSQIHSIRHIVELIDGQFIIIGHINCEFCKYCEDKSSNLRKIETAHFCTGPHKFLEKMYDDH